RAGGELLGRGAGGRARPALRARRSGEGRLATARRPRARARPRRRDAPARRLALLGGLAGGEPGGLRLAAGGGVLVERAVRGRPVEPAHELPVPLADRGCIVAVGGLLEPPHQRLPGRAPPEVLPPLAGGLANALLLLSDVRHRRENARFCGLHDGSRRQESAPPA